MHADYKMVMFNMAGVDFYDVDEEWYYIIPNAFCIKLPLVLLCNHIDWDKERYEFDYIHEIEKNIIEYLLGSYTNEDEQFANFLKEKNIDKRMLFEELQKEKFPLYIFAERHKEVYNYFDRWIVVKTNDECSEVTGFIVKRRTETRTETIYWE